jgi:Reverse transcriptase (RNA-dependent DNA polymerase).
MIKAGVGNFVLRSINLLILYEIRRNCLSSGRSQSLYVLIRRVTDCSNYRGINLFSTTHKILSNILLSKLAPCAEEITGDHQCGFRGNRSTKDHTLCLRQILEKKLEYNEAQYQLFMDIKKACDSVRREVLCNMLIELGISMKLVRIIKVYLKGTYSTDRVDKHLSDLLPINNGLKKKVIIYRRSSSTGGFRQTSRA